MRNATATEFNKAVAKAKWPEPEFLFSGRAGKVSTATYKDHGVEVAARTIVTSKNSAKQIFLAVNDSYL
jgi:hypothetical protein